jgi:cysteine desulfurase
MSTAADLGMADMEERADRLSGLRDELVSSICGSTDATSIGHPDHRLSGYALVCFSGVSATTFLDALAAHDIAVSSGSACHSGDPSPSRVLLAMGVDPDLATGAIRFSMGRETTQVDLKSVSKMVKRVLRDGQT